MSENDEAIALLREIRDLQKAHFERYQHFTDAALKRGEETAEVQKRLIATTAQARELDLQYRHEMRQHQVEARAAAARMRTIVIVGLALQLLLVYGLGYVVLALLRR